MERNFGVKVETRQTVKLRSNFNRKRRFLSRFYKTDWVKVPTRTELVLYIILLFVGLVILSSYSDLTEIFRVLIVCSILTLLYRITCYFKNKNGWLHMRLPFLASPPYNVCWLWVLAGDRFVLFIIFCTFISSSSGQAEQRIPLLHKALNLACNKDESIFIKIQVESSFLVSISFHCIILCTGTKQLLLRQWH